MSQTNTPTPTSPRIVQKPCAAHFPLIEAALLPLNKEEDVMVSKFIIASAVAAAAMVAAASSADAQDYRYGQGHSSQGYQPYRPYQPPYRPTTQPQTPPDISSDPRQRDPRWDRERHGRPEWPRWR
jgi:hypothetical protein